MAPERALSYPAGMTQEARTAAPARLSSWLLFAAVALAPLPFGSNEPTAIAFWCIVLGACLVFAPVRSLSAGQLALAGLAGIVVAAYALVLHEQLAEHPWLAAATPDPIWQEARGSTRCTAPAVGLDSPQSALVRAWPAACLHAGDCLRLSGRRRPRARPAAPEGDRLVGCRLRDVRHPGASLRPDPHPVARETGLSRLRDRDLHQPQYRGGLFRLLRGGVVAPALGAGAAARCRAVRFSGGRCRPVYCRVRRQGSSSHSQCCFYVLRRCS